MSQIIRTYVKGKSWFPRQAENAYFIYNPRKRNVRVRHKTIWSWWNKHNRKAKQIIMKCFDY